MALGRSAVGQRPRGVCRESAGRFRPGRVQSASQLADFGRALAALPREHDGLPVRGELHVVQRVRTGNSNTHATAFDPDILNCLVTAIDYGKEQPLRIR